jgi:hypothetical protein
MAGGHSFGPTRDLREGRVSFDGWEGLNEHEKLAARAFEEGIENSLLDNPPSMAVGFTTNDKDEADDIVLTFSLSALGNGTYGPCWEFSLKDALTRLCDYGEEDRLGFLRALMAVVRHVNQQIKNPLDPRSDGPRRKPRVIGLDGQDVPQSASKQWVDELMEREAPRMMQALMEATQAIRRTDPQHR